MEHYLVSARKYRPSTFASVVGQRTLTTTLKNAIASNRLAHSYLFCGSRGVGKTSCARIFAKTINCEHPTADGEACNECDSCRAFNDGNSLNIIELDAASNNGVEAMRDLVSETMVAPSRGRYRVFIIDEVHMLSNSAFNAFLKTLEEPPAHVIFILATTEKHKIIPTILSRCQIYDFNTISIRDIVAHLKMVAQNEGMTADEAALGLIARKADGAMRDALSIFDQVAASTRGNITYDATLDNLNELGVEIYTRLVEAFLAGNVMETWLIYKEVRTKGFDSHFFINGLAAYLRNLMVAREPSTRTLLDTDDASARVMIDTSAKCAPDFLYRAMCLLNDADLNYRVSSNKQFLVELTLAKICQQPGLSSDEQSSYDEGLKPIARPAAATPAPQAPAQPAQAQAATSAPRQATAPAMTPRRPAGGVRHPQLGNGPSLKGHTQTAEKPAAAAAASHRDAAYTPRQLQEAWMEFMKRNPAEKILVNTMRASRPEPGGAPHAYKVMVENDMQRQLMQAKTPQLLGFLRDALSNDSVTLEIEVSDGPGTADTWNEREVLAHMLEEVPALRSYIDTFHLSLG